MSERTGTGRAAKPRGQDVAGFLFCAVGGFFAVSISLALFGWESRGGAWTWPVEELLALLGPWASLFLGVGVALLGCVLFLHFREVSPGRPLGGLLGLALGLALLLGARGGSLGGDVGSALPGLWPDLWKGFPGGALAAILGVALLWVSLRIGFMGSAQGTDPRTKQARQRWVESGAGLDAADGVSAAEAALLVTEPPRRPKSVPLPGPSEPPPSRGSGGRAPARDVRTDPAPSPRAAASDHATPRAAASDLAAPRAAASDHATPRAAASDLAAPRAAAPVAARPQPNLRDETIRPLPPPTPIAAPAGRRPVAPAPVASEQHAGTDLAQAEGERSPVRGPDRAAARRAGERAADAPQESSAGLAALDGTREAPAWEPAWAAADEEDEGGDGDDLAGTSAPEETWLDLPAGGELESSAGAPSWEQSGLFDEQEASPDAALHEPEEATFEADELEDALDDDADEQDEDEDEDEVEEDEADEDGDEAGAHAAAEDGEEIFVLEPVVAAAVDADASDEGWEQLVFDAGCLILEQNRVAVSMIERRFEIDFDRACEVLDRLQKAGLIGPYMGGRTRDILLSREEWLAHAP